MSLMRPCYVPGLLGRPPCVPADAPDATAVQSVCSQCHYAARRMTKPATRYGFAREPGAPFGDAIPTVTVQGIVKVA